MRPLNSGGMLVDGLGDGGSAVKGRPICGSNVEVETKSSGLVSGRLDTVGRMSSEPGVDGS